MTGYPHSFERLIYCFYRTRADFDAILTNKIRLKMHNNSIVFNFHWKHNCINNS